MEASGVRPELDLLTRTGHVSVVNALAFSPDGGTLAGACGRGDIALIDVRTGRLLRTLPADRDSYDLALAFTPDGATLAASDIDRRVTLWDLQTSARAATLLPSRARDFNPGDGNMASPRAVLAVSPDGRTLAVGGYGHTVRLWDLPARAERHVLPAHNLVIQALAFSPDGGILATCNEAVKLWDVATGRLLRTLATDSQNVAALAFAPDGKTLASGGPWRFDSNKRSEADEITLWEMETGRSLWTAAAHTAGLRRLAFAPDGETLVSAGALWRIEDYQKAYAEIKYWDAATGRLLRALPAGRGAVQTLVLSPEGARLLANGPQGEIQIRDARSGDVRASLLLFPTSRSDQSQSDWIAWTPEGFYDGSPGAERFLRWRIGDTLHPAHAFAADFHRPDRVQAALRGEEPR